ncbi:DUF515 domain-containing protein [Thermococcus argininiproducens]|uniref:DUF515 domain-containing protein n=1 Tax=Thermococcus argininiproducens TaxID=2866384 RepID=A0A9E7MBU3_9EURY|nr:DUF515 domain-containing protein [Thermococcus argininiproducens]
MVVLTVAEDIEEKIRRLRELGKVSVEERGESKTPSVPVARPSGPTRKPSRLGRLRERERRRRIIIGASILAIIIIAVVVGVYITYQNRAAKQLEEAKLAKIAEVNKYFTGELQNDTLKTQLINQISRAQSVEELEKIDVKTLAEQRKAQLEEEKRQKELQDAKTVKLSEIEQSFELLLSQPLPADIKSEAIQSLNQLKERVNSAETKDEVLLIDPNPYLLDLWRKYYYYLIDATPTQKVILKKGVEKSIYTKPEAKYVLSKITDFAELMQYTIEKAEMVQVALVLPRENVNGAFLSSGDKVKIFAQVNATSIQKIADEGYITTVLLLKDSGEISVSESQTESNNIESSTETSYSDQYSESYAPGDQSITYEQSKDESHSTTQSSSQTITASYTYNVALSEILKAIAANKIAAPDEVKEQLSRYMWKVFGLEQDTGLMATDPTAKVLVIVEVPAEFVEDILKYRNALYITKIVG